MKSQPDVAILELLETEKPLDLAPLRRLKNLYGLVLGGTYDLDVVQTLKSLHFLGISDDSWPESPEKVAEIRAALPDAVVIHIEPICLGSGWGTISLGSATRSRLGSGFGAEGLIRGLRSGG